VLQCVILRMSSRAAYNPANPGAAVSVGTIAAKLSAPNGISGKSWGQAVADATAAGVTVRITGAPCATSFPVPSGASTCQLTILRRPSASFP